MELFVQAFIIMVLGMGVTFAFLGIVIAGVEIAARAIHAIEGPPSDEAHEASASSLDGKKLAAVVAVALHTGRTEAG